MLHSLYQTQYTALLLLCFLADKTTRTLLSFTVGEKIVGSGMLEFVWTTSEHGYIWYRT